MDIKVNLEPHSATDDPELQGSNIKIEIKQEDELIIESETQCSQTEEFVDEEDNEENDSNQDVQLMYNEMAPEHIGTDDPELQGSSGSNIQIEIKQEDELIIETETQRSQTEEFDEDDEENDSNQDVQSMYNEMAYGQNTIEFLDDNDDYEDDNDDCVNEIGKHNDLMAAPNVDNEADKDDLEFEYFSQSLAKNSENSTKAMDLKNLYKFGFKKWINNNYIKRNCPTCKNDYSYAAKWRNHVNICHQKPIKESQCHFLIKDKLGSCKTCKKVYTTDLSRYIHSLTHTGDSSNFNINICKVCNYKFGIKESIQRHVLKEHPQAMEEFGKSDNVKNPFKCHLCHSTYETYKKLCYHFMDSHPKEYESKFIYNCHLCLHEQFIDIELYFQHLMEKHDLNSWEILNYRKLFSDKEYYSCKKCHKMFLENDIRKLLKHFLGHETECQWSCKYCQAKFTLVDSNFSHMCRDMLRFFIKIQTEELENEDSKNENSSNEEMNINSLEDFEEYILHICPFCNNNFDHKSKWQQHLREVHQIDSHKSLGMKPEDGDDDQHKLCCVICFTVVPNTSELLRNHCFQHLPYRPYKCRHCNQTLENLKTALNHVSKRCKDEEDRDYIKNVIVRKIIEPAKTIRSLVIQQCPFCNCKKFDDENDVLEHHEEEHNNFEEFFSKEYDNSMICKICEKKFVQYDKKTCLSHMFTHCDEKSFKCSICGHAHTTFRGCYMHLVENHFAKTLNKKKAQEQKPCLAPEDELHLAEHHQMAKPSNVSYVLNEFSEFISYACPECNEGMSTQKEWYSHITTQHNFFNESEMGFKDADGSLKCRTCKKILGKTPSQRQKHKLTHMPFRSFICNLCYCRCTIVALLYSHMRRCHFAEGTFKCPLCEAVLKTSHARAEHLKNMHPRDEWPKLMCLICYKIFEKKQYFTGHMMTHDRDRFKYECEVCGAKIVFLKGFKTHMQRHERRGESKKSETEDNKPDNPSGSKCIQGFQKDEVGSKKKEANKPNSPGPSSIKKRKLN